MEISVAHEVCWPDHLNTQACVGLQVWVNEIFEKMDQVELTWRYVK